MRMAVIGICALVLAVAIVAGVRQAREQSGAATRPLAALTRAEVSKPIAGAPPDLAALRRRVGVLAGGGVKAFDAQLRALHGHPIVVNLWGSWCEPCRRELPLFQRAALRRGARVAFLGVDVTDDADGAAKLLAAVPVPYPSFVDPRSNIATGRLGVRVFPTTAFYDARGKLAILHQGEFANEAKLSEAIERYALR